MLLVVVTRSAARTNCSLLWSLHSSISSTAVHSPSQFNLEPQSVKPSAVEELQPLLRSLLFSAFPSIS
ncbi:unnamed protein product [Trifolium pratense]|uniref:Uncharacterized protein n=1 Tax=Trifolium pratense TaxID=57577 RepID=A0ACB0JD43_TRIPR|nr:unnamed protein product [Trifolium pratense]